MSPLWKKGTSLVVEHHFTTRNRCLVATPRRNLSNIIPSDRPFQQTILLQLRRLQLRRRRLEGQSAPRSYHSRSSNNHHDNNTTTTNANVIRPYSESLPSPNHEWCSRCQIRLHRFQKPIGKHNACLDAPRLFGWGICRPARNYYQNQCLHMISLSLACFLVAPWYNQWTTSTSSETEETRNNWDP